MSLVVKYRLTRKEAELFGILPETPISEEAIKQRMWPAHQPAPGSGAVSALVARLREKLGKDAVLTFHGWGYARNPKWKETD